MNYSLAERVHLDTVGHILFYTHRISNQVSAMSTRIQVLGLARCVATRPVASSVVPRAGYRFYATHSDRVPPSGPSSQNPNYDATTQSTAELLRRLEAESRRQGGSSGFGGQESVGPFPLGVGPSGRRKVWRPWGELGVKGKCMSAAITPFDHLRGISTDRTVVWRSTQQTGNLAVVLVGASLVVVLTFALTTELFATNSPSVLYSQAVDKIRASDAVSSSHPQELSTAPPTIVLVIL